MGTQPLQDHFQHKLQIHSPRTGFPAVRQSCLEAASGPQDETTGAGPAQCQVLRQATLHSSHAPTTKPCDPCRKQGVMSISESRKQTHRLQTMCLSSCRGQHEMQAGLGLGTAHPPPCFAQPFFPQRSRGGKMPVSSHTIRFWLSDLTCLVCKS